VPWQEEEQQRRESKQKLLFFFFFNRFFSFVALFCRFDLVRSHTFTHFLSQLTLCSCFQTHTTHWLACPFSFYVFLILAAAAAAVAAAAPAAAVLPLLITSKSILSSSSLCLPFLRPSRPSSLPLYTQLHPASHPHQSR
jgi:hypothetical protein